MKSAIAPVLRLNLCLNATTRHSLRCHSRRCVSSKAPKRFFKDVSVVSHGNDYELTLDSRKIKTPLGNVFKVKSEGLAQAVAQEWRSQKDMIMMSQMHLTGLANVSIDNPTKVTPEQMTESVMNFLDTDTVLFFSDDGNEVLRERQESSWQPIIDWFNDRHQAQITPSRQSVLEAPHIPGDSRSAVRRYLLSLSFDALHGFATGVDVLKSVVLMSGVVDKIISVEDAVKLARLEVEVQTDRWGNVEWAHDVELHDTTARVAAAAMFVQLNSNSHKMIEKSSPLVQ